MQRFAIYSRKVNSSPGDITKLLVRVRVGDLEAKAALIQTVHQELRRIAARSLRRERPEHTLQVTALVHEAYIQLLGDAKVDWQDRGHFFASASQSMRRILVDYARKRKAAKREGGRVRVELDDKLAIAENRVEEILAIDEALARLGSWDPRQARIVEMKFFAGLTEDEIAAVLGLSRRTVIRDWNVARAWLRAELDGSKPSQRPE